MEVTFVKTSKSNLNNVPVEPGQFVFTDDSKQLYMDFDQERKGVACQDEVDAIVDVNGCCNVFAIDNPILLTGVDVSNNGIINISTDTIPLFNFMFRAFVSDSPFELASEYINETGDYAFYITIPNNTQRLMFKHDGAKQDLAITIPAVPAGNYKLTFTVVSCDPTTVGGLAISNIMLYDARLNPTGYVSYAMTNQQLTENFSNNIKTSRIQGTTQSDGNISTGIDNGKKNSFCSTFDRKYKSFTAS